MQEPVKTAWAGALKNREFIYIETYSGYRSCHDDPKGKQYLLAVDVNNVSSGEALLDALAHSRFLLPKEDPELFSYEKSDERYQQWVAEIMKRYGYKSRRAMFKDMHSCSVESSEGAITISPSWHEKLEMWSRTRDKNIEVVVVPDNSSPEEVGAALRLAFSRCK